jgi:hypothetical protein
MLKTTLLFVVSLSGMVIASGASDEIDYKFQYYNDNNKVNVNSNAVNIRKKINDNFSISLNGLIDAISGASRKDNRGAIKSSALASNNIDATTSASKTDEKRYQPSLTIVFFKDFFKGKGKESNSDNPTTITVTGVNSSENDYLSRTISGSFSQDLFERNTTIGFRYGKTFNKQFPATRFIPENNNPGWNYFGEGTGQRQTDNVSASLTQGITTTTSAQIIYGYSYDRGYMARPYYVSKIDSQFYDENLPVCRTSSTITALLSQYIPLGKGFSLHCNYRYYQDSWSQVSHTIEGELYAYITDNLVIRPSGRFYTQSSSFFYKDVYDKTDRYLTTDLKYRGGKTYNAGLKLSYIIKDFVKPEGGSFFSFFPVSIDLGFDYFIRESPSDPAVLANYYQYYGAGDNFQAFWIQSGIRFVF